MTDPIIDTHHHLWRAAQVPWLNGPMQPRIFGDYSAIRRDYLPEEYAAEVQPQGVVKSVYVQVNVAPGDEVREVATLQSFGDAHGFPGGIIAYADLYDPTAATTLDQELAYRRVRGIRQQLHWHVNPLYCYAQRPDLMNDSAFRAGMKALAARGLLFELQVFSSQMQDAARLAADFPQVTFVLLHAGMLDDRSPEGWQRWRAGMRLLAACPNVVVKLSGLGTFARACSLALWKPVVEETLEFFGPARCMFGSNFPIEKLWTSYGELVSVMKACLAGLSAQDRQAVFHDNAARIYRL